MKILLFHIILLFLVGCSNESQNDVNSIKEKYKLVYHDEFEYNSLDSSKWLYWSTSPAPYDRVLPRGNCDYTNAAVLSKSNILLNRGILNLIAKKENITYRGICEGEEGQDLGCGFVSNEPFEFNQKYSSASVFSKKGFKNGLFECRAKIPSAEGLYPVFWLWHHDEIVVFEFFGNSKFHFVSSHNKEKYVTKKFKLLDYSKEFHNYAVHWTNNSITWYFDDKKIWTICRDLTNNSSNCNLHSKADNNNFTIQESYPDSIDRWLSPNISLRVYEWSDYVEDNKLPDTLMIDYVRIYQ